MTSIFSDRDQITGFISRELNDDSPLNALRKHIPALYWIDQSLIRFDPVLFTHIPSSDWIFCTSSRAVHFFLQCVEEHQMPLTGQIHWAAMGPGTAQSLLDRGIEVEFTGNGHPVETARDFLKSARGQTVLFPRARHSRRSIQRELKNEVQSIDLVVYDNAIREEIDLPPLDLVILTSPMNARGFVKHYSFEAPEIILAWGGSTEAQLHRLNLTRTERLEAPSERAAADRIRKLLKV